MNPSDAPILMQRLRDGSLEALVDLALDEFQSRPLAELADPAWLAQRMVGALQAAADNPSSEAWLRERLAGLRARMAEPEAFDADDNLRRRLPAELIEPAQALLAEPYVPERALMLRLLDHEAMHSLIQEVLHDILVRFGRKLRNLTPDTGRLAADAGRLAAGLGRGRLAAGLGRSRLPSGLSRLKDLSTGVASVVGAELEHQLDQRAREFGSQAISAVLGQVATLLTAPERAETLSDWRAHGLGVILDTELADWAKELRKLEEEQLLGTAKGMLQALARREGLQEEIEALARSAMDELGSTSFGDQLQESGMEQEWRETTRSLLLESLSSLIETPAFQSWLEDWLAKGH